MLQEYYILPALRLSYSSIPSLWTTKMSGSRVSIVDTANLKLSGNDVVVALMGPTGSGKSSFIEQASGIMGIAGHGLQSYTSEISVFKFQGPTGVDLYLVDTPGFDDMNKSDLEIFKLLSKWLIKSYEKGVRLRGLLYFHRISDERIGGTSLKNFHFFEQLCGEDFGNIVLTTTMWGEVDEWVGAAREEELKRDYWRPMINRGSYVKRFLYTQESAFEVLTPFLAEANRRGVLRMNDHSLPPKETPAKLKKSSGGLRSIFKFIFSRGKKKTKGRGAEAEEAGTRSG